MMNSGSEQVLDDLRQSIDHIDNSFIFIIAERIRLVVKSIVFKQQQNLPLSYSLQRQQDLQKTIKLAVEHQVDEKFIRKLFDHIYLQAQLINEQTFSTQNQTLSKSELFSIKEIQESIYHIDVALCCLLAERYHLVKKVGRLKKSLNIPPLASTRWEKILSNKLTMAAALNLDINFVETLLNNMHLESLRIENNIINDL